MIRRAIAAEDGWLVQADCMSHAVARAVVERVGRVPLVVADPPYGNVAAATWDKSLHSPQSFAEEMVTWTSLWADLALLDGGAMYVWGGIGKPGFRPFFHYLASVESGAKVSLSTLITWKKKRAYGTPHSYLFTREECAYLVKGDPKKPRTFHVPYLDKKRGYAGFDAKHPAKSEYLRRSNVWDETEILRGKVHEAQKADRVCEIPIEVHTDPGETVIDLFAGSASTAAAARRLGRRWVAIERGDEEFEVARQRMGLA